MPSKKPLSDAELEAWESSRNIGAELEQSVREMLAGNGAVAPVSPVVAVRIKSGLSQSQFATLLGVSVRTLQEWEQGRRQPSGAAKTLIAIAEKRPEVLTELAA
ncbi:XRE family transcriptional regulator [Sulfuricella denitrificans skB26]|uniref:XRE family transcriptional regulator n=1 Tax=Sulfuricella denitrificans (strain DSM 22764 / NBRC 105220 / skB26) TaxID=1163617 RepID=S6AM18_SULDS|nr:helix-turn-helix domain-containing protein [Sulfuricella denitrificans]BAN35764.1 XRE family transcriptional regulator [Sulfuricella denitrificans skB26]